MEHDNLTVYYGISKNTTGNTTKLGLEYTLVAEGFDLNNLKKGNVRCVNFVNAPKNNTFFFVSAFEAGINVIQEATELFNPNNEKYVRAKINGAWGPWREQVGDKSVIDGLLAQKQDVLTAGEGITIQGNTISATAPVQGASISIQDFAANGFNAWKHVVTSGGKTLVTFSFQCNQAETVITGALKQQLENFIQQSATVSNGAISITRDGAYIKLLNSAASPNVYQHGTFTFYSLTGGGGGAE